MPYQNRNGEISGTIGQGNSLKEINIALLNADSKNKINYSVYFKDVGLKTHSNYGKARCKNKNIEAIKINLSNELEKNYNIFYRVYIQNYGWLAWARNGEIVGSINFGLRTEAIQTKLIKNNTIPKDIPFSRKPPAIINI